MAVHIPALGAHRAAPSAPAEDSFWSSSQSGAARHNNIYLPRSTVTAANDADHLLTTASSAAALVFLHPQLSSTNSTIAGNIMINTSIVP